MPLLPPDDSDSLQPRLETTLSGLHPQTDGETGEHAIHPSAFIHTSAYVDAPCRIGCNTQILHFTHIMTHPMAPTQLGNDCRVAQHVTVYPGVIMGDRVAVMENVRLSSGVLIYNDVYCGPSVTISGANKLRAQVNPSRPATLSPTLIKQHATIGANVAIAGGVTIGAHAFVEGASVVDKHVPNYAIVRGNPLRLVGWRCQCGQTLHFSKALCITPGAPTAKKSTHSQCSHCGRAYKQWAPQRIEPLEEPLLSRQHAG
ncbi:MAG: acyltransferase [Vampirovibrionales bacterium]